MEGIIPINKPKGYTSRDVVNEVSKILNIKKIGHTGTLDPIATGVLVLCMGKATKISSFITALDKCYQTEILLGVETDTLDITGNIIKKDKIPSLTEKDIKTVLLSFVGEIEQEVPLYSAVKVKGKKLYQYARAQEKVKLPKKKIMIKELNLIDGPVKVKDGIKFKIECKVSKGTYIRSLIRDIGYCLGTVATMTSLIRTKQGQYELSDCYTLDDLRKSNFKIISIKDALLHLPIIKINAELSNKIRNGAIVERFFETEKAVILDLDDNVLAIYQIDSKDSNKVRPYQMIFSKHNT
ncbi:MAG: tRNA pseudouridine(55) synthase TruB [Bacilli bacterium]|jgi:tRNA pseudouridine55 synthase|nr:tRNA pseudouridine(55) synthase TruB [Bacilli bacterium]